MRPPPSRYAADAGMGASVQRWYLIHTKPLGEETARANLERQGYGVYFPQLLETGPFAGGCRQHVTALFPRYLFVRVEEDTQALSPLHSTVGVVGVVRFGSRYTVVPDDVVKDLRNRADPDSGLHRLSSGAPLMRGSVVRITNGPFEGLEGVFERKVGVERVVVLLDLLGQRASVHVPARFVLPAVSA